MITTNFDYESCVRASERISWKLDEVFPASMKLDFSRRFLPETLQSTDVLTFLDAGERLKLNQIMGNSYLNLFSFVEEYIVASVLHYAHGTVSFAPSQQRALLRFADEELKHQQLFRRFRDAFERDFGVPCDVLGDPQAVVRLVMGKAPMAVLLTTLHFELLTQQHYVEGFREDGGGSLDPLFASLLKNHWLEESQHAKIDALELKHRADLASAAEIDASVGEYLDILRALAELLAEQARLDVVSLARATGRDFTVVERARIATIQTQAYRVAFLALGVENQGFIKYLDQLSSRSWERVDAQVRAMG